MTVAPYLIHPDQAGFIKGRKIEDQIDLIKTMISVCEADCCNRTIVCLDQEKAYDKISHTFLWATLRKLGLPPHFINTIKHLYALAETHVIVNGETSRPFCIKRGVCQGDPLSCLLFNLTIESLAEMLRKSSLAGFHVAGLPDRILTALFADDTTVFLEESDNYSTLQAILRMWCCASGVKFNIQKTILIPVGTPAHRLHVTQS